MFAPSGFFIPGVDDHQKAVCKKQSGGNGIAHGWSAYLLSRGLEKGRLEAVNMPFFLWPQEREQGLAKA